MAKEHDDEHEFDEADVVRIRASRIIGILSGAIIYLLLRNCKNIDRYEAYPQDKVPQDTISCDTMSRDTLPKDTVVYPGLAIKKWRDSVFRTR